MTEADYTILRNEVLKADHERLFQAGWLAMSELGPQPDEIDDWFGFCMWVEALHKRAEQIFRRLQ